MRQQHVSRRKVSQYYWQPGGRWVGGRFLLASRPDLDEEPLSLHLSPCRKAVVAVAGLLALPDQDVRLPDLPPLVAPKTESVVEMAWGLLCTAFQHCGHSFLPPCRIKSKSLNPSFRITIFPWALQPRLEHFSLPSTAQARSPCIPAHCTQSRAPRDPKSRTRQRAVSDGARTSTPQAQD